jgi:hypothetical protein
LPLTRALASQASERLSLGGVRPLPASLSWMSSKPQSLTQAEYRGVDGRAHREILEHHGIEARHVLREGNVKYSISDAFDIGRGRIGVLAVVFPKGGRPTLRAFYRSGSTGGFRALPARSEIKGLRAEFHPPGFDKGAWDSGDKQFFDESEDAMPRETFLDLPNGVQRQLARIVQEGGVRRDVPGEEILTGAVRQIHTLDEYLAYQGMNSFAVGLQAIERLVEPKRNPRWLKQLDGKRVLHPEDVHIADARMPAFEQRVKHWSQDEQLGHFDYETYLSKDRSLIYTYRIDDRMRTEVRVEKADAPLNSYGVRERAVDSEYATPQLWERYQSIVPEFRGPPHPTSPKYFDNWQHARQTPLATAFYRAKGWAVPE